MHKLTVLVQGSASEPYEVKLRKDGNNLTAVCSCPAGMMGQYCRHRFQILEGKPTGVVSDNRDAVSIVKQWLVGTDVETALEELRDAEKAAEKANKKLVNAKKHLARAMGD